MQKVVHVSQKGKGKVGEGCTYQGVLMAQNSCVSGKCPAHRCETLALVEGENQKLELEVHENCMLELDASSKNEVMQNALSRASTLIDTALHMFPYRD